MHASASIETLCTILAQFGWTALHWAVSGQHVGTTQTLLNSKANILAQDQTGETVLHWAAANNNMSMVQMLLDHGASVDLCNKVVLG